jgi:hypothetical protein
VSMLWLFLVVSKDPKLNFYEQFLVHIKILFFVDFVGITSPRLIKVQYFFSNFSSLLINRKIIYDHIYTPLLNCCIVFSFLQIFYCILICYLKHKIGYCKKSQHKIAIFWWQRNLKKMPFTSLWEHDNVYVCARQMYVLVAKLYISFLKKNHFIYILKCKVSTIFVENAHWILIINWFK